MKRISRESRSGISLLISIQLCTTRHAIWEMMLVCYHHNKTTNYVFFFQKTLVLLIEPAYFLFLFLFSHPILSSSPSSSPYHCYCNYCCCHCWSKHSCLPLLSIHIFWRGNCNKRKTWVSSQYISNMNVRKNKT